MSVTNSGKITSDAITDCFKQTLDFVKKGSISLHFSIFDNSFCTLYDADVVEQEAKKNKEKIMSKLLKILFFIIFFTSNSFSKDLIYSGFSLQGNFSYNTINYPYFSKIIENNNEINQQLFQLMKDNTNLIIQKSDDDDGLVVSFGLVTENTNLTEINEYVKNEYVIYPQVFIYDNKTKNYISSISTRLSVATKTTLSDKITNQDSSYQAYKDVILSNEPKVSYVGRCVDSGETNTSFLNIYKILLSCINLQEITRFNLQVRDIDLGNSDYTNFSFLKKDADYVPAIKYKLANLVTAYTSHLTYNNQFLVLPHSKEQSIANVQNRFSDTQNLNIGLPEPDFVIDVLIKGVRKKKINEDDDEANFMYALGINYKILEPYSGTIIFDGDFKHFKKIQFAKNLENGNIIQTEENDFFYYNQLLGELSGDITKNLLTENLTKDNKSWIKIHINDKKNYQKVIDDHKKIINTFF